MAMELRKMSIDYERRRMQLQVYYGELLILSHALFMFSDFRLCLRFWA